MPTWDEPTSELRFAGALVRRYPARAVNLRRLLDAFDRAGWTESIPNPFRGRHAAHLLANAIQRLRRDPAVRKHLWFEGDGNGGARWKPVSPPAPSPDSEASEK